MICTHDFFHGLNRFLYILHEKVQPMLFPTVSNRGGFVLVAQWYFLRGATFTTFDVGDSEVVFPLYAWTIFSSCIGSCFGLVAVI